MQAILLKCYLGKNGDANNVLLLYEDRLIVLFRGNATVYAFDQIRSMAIGKKKFIIPLVVGGIGTCLSWLALSLGWYHYYTNLFLVFAFFSWMYYGFIGSDALMIVQEKHSEMYLIKANHFVLNSFLRFAKQRIGRRLQPPRTVIYHLTHWQEWKAQEESQFYIPQSFTTDGFIHVSTAEGVVAFYEKYFKPSDQLILIGIHQSDVAPPKTEPTTSRNATFTHICGKLNKSAILSLRLMSGSLKVENKIVDN